MAKSKKRKLHKNIVVAFARLVRAGEALCRQASATEEAVKAGGGFVYFMKNCGKEMLPSSSRFLIENGLVEGEQDGLFPGLEQTFKPVPSGHFEEFKSAWENMQVARMWLRDHGRSAKTPRTEHEILIKEEDLSMFEEVKAAYLRALSNRRASA